MKPATQWATEANYDRVSDYWAPWRWSAGLAWPSIARRLLAQYVDKTGGAPRWTPEVPTYLYPLHLFPEESAVLLDMPVEALIAIAKMGNPLACSLVPIKVASLKKRKQREALHHHFPITIGVSP